MPADGRPARPLTRRQPLAVPRRRPPHSAQTAGRVRGRPLACSAGSPWLRSAPPPWPVPPLPPAACSASSRGFAVCCLPVRSKSLSNGSQAGDWPHAWGRGREGIFFFFRNRARAGQTAKPVSGPNLPISAQEDKVVRFSFCFILCRYMYMSICIYTQHGGRLGPARNLNAGPTQTA